MPPNEEISSNHAPLINETGRNMESLPVGPDGKPLAPGVDPRLTAAMDDTDKQNRRGKDRVAYRGDRTRKFAEGVEERDRMGARNVRGDLGASMPPVTQAAQPAAAPVTSAPAMSFPEVPAPTNLARIDPALLAALVAAAQEQSALGVPSEMTGDAFSPSWATTPQNPDPLSLSQVSYAKYPLPPGANALSDGEIAAVIDQALTINGVPNDPDLRAQWQQLYQHMASGESTGNPNAYNNGDDNAVGVMEADGAMTGSSRGLWQCVPGTFAAYHMAGTSNSIYDPVASAAASMNYVMNTYGVSPTGEGLTAFAAARGLFNGTYKGY